MSTQTRRKTRKISRKFIIISALVIVIVGAIIFFLIKSGVGAGVIAWLGGGGAIVFVGGIWRRMNTDPSTKQKVEQAIVSLQKKASSLEKSRFFKWIPGILKWIFPPSSEEAPKKTDFYILYHLEDEQHPFNQTKAGLIEKVLLDDEEYQISLKTEPWKPPNDFSRALERSCEATHCIIIVSESLVRALRTFESTPRLPAGTFESRLREIARRGEPTEENPNKSKGSLVFLDGQLYIEFKNKSDELQIEIEAFTLFTDEPSAIQQIKTAIPFAHCKLRSQTDPPNVPVVSGTTSAIPVEPDVSTLPRVGKPGILRMNTAPDKNAFFVPRLSLDNLAEHLDNNAIQILYGPMGSGKTQIALEFAHQNFQGRKGEYPARRYSHIFWLDATSSLEEDIQKKFKRDMFHSKPSDKTWLEHFLAELKFFDQRLKPDQRWLLIIDGCKTSSEFMFIYEHITGDRYTEDESYLPRGNYGGHIILTVPMREIQPQAIDDNYRREVPYMYGTEREQAVRLLVSTAIHYADLRVKEDLIRLTEWPEFQEKEERDLYWNAAGELVEELDYNPLLINSAGVYMRDLKREPKESLGLYRETLEKIMRNPEEEFKKVYGPNFHWEAKFVKLLSVWSISYEKIRDNADQRPYQIFMLCAFLNNGQIPRVIIDCSENDTFVDISRSINVLVAQEFIRYEVLSGRLIRLRKIVRDAIHALPDGPGSTPERQTFQRKAIFAVSKAFRQEKEKDSWKVGDYELYRPHIGKCVEYLEDGAFQKYLKQQPDVHQRTAFLFLFTVSSYLQEHPEEEKFDYPMDASYRGDQTVKLTADHLFRLAIQVYEAWSPSGQNDLELARAFAAIARFYHFQVFHAQKDKSTWRSGLEVAARYYSYAEKHVKDLAVSDAIILDIYRSLGCLCDDLGKHQQAEDYFQAIMKRFPNYITGSQCTYPPEISLKIAEVLEYVASRSFKKMLSRQGQQDQQVYADIAKKYDHALTLLAALEEVKTFQERIVELRRCCLLGKLRLSLLRPQSVGREMLQAEVALSKSAVDQSLKFFTKNQQSTDLYQALKTYHNPDDMHFDLYIGVDLSDLAQAYYRLALLERSRTRKKNHFIQSVQYTELAMQILVTYYDKVPQGHAETRAIAEVIWKNACLNRHFASDKASYKEVFCPKFGLLSP